MGNFLKIFSDRVSVIASARLWLEDAAVQQLLTTAVGRYEKQDAQLRGNLA